MFQTVFLSVELTGSLITWCQLLGQRMPMKFEFLRSRILQYILKIHIQFIKNTYQKVLY